MITKPSNKNTSYLKMNWNPNIADYYNERLKSALFRASSEALKVSNDSFIPVDTGETVLSSFAVVTSPNEGEITWATDYAAYTYNKNPWFDRMVSEYSLSILHKAEEGFKAEGKTDVYVKGMLNKATKRTMTRGV